MVSTVRPTRGGLGLHQRRSRADFDGVGDGAHRELNVDTELGGRAELDAALHGLLESGRLDLHAVRSDEQIGHDIIAGAVGDRAVFLAVALIGNGDVRTRDDGLRRIANESRDLAGIKLRMRSGERKKSKKYKPDSVAHKNPLLRRVYSFVH